MIPSGALAFLTPVLVPRLWGARRRGWSGQSPAGQTARAWQHRCLALEHMLDELSDRLARTEIALQREEQACAQTRARLAEAENAVIRLQSTLEALRQPQSA